jgi:hypothetical protein
MNLRKQIGATLLAAAVVAAPAEADTLDFEGIAAQAVGYKDVVEHKGYSMTGESALDDALPGDLVGGIMNGSKPTDCLWLSCPVNNSTTYYAGLNDGVMLLERDDHKAFSLLSLDASFVGAMQGAATPDIPGILRIQGFRADYTYDIFDVELHQSNRQFFFENTSTGDFGKDQFIAMAFFGLACGDGGDCHAFETNQGQFAIDNLNVSVSAVPEPSNIAMLGGGLLVMGAMTRRRKNQRFASKEELSA